MSLFDLHTWADVRSLLYTATTPVLGFLTYLGVVDGHHAALWGALAAAVLSPLLAAFNTANKFRQWFYPVLAAVQAVVVGYGVFSNSWAAVVVSVVTALVGSAVAGANVPTSAST